MIRRKGIPVNFSSSSSSSSLTEETRAREVDDESASKKKRKIGKSNMVTRSQRGLDKWTYPRSQQRLAELTGPYQDTKPSRIEIVYPPFSKQGEKRGAAHSLREKEMLALSAVEFLRYKDAIGGFESHRPTTSEWNVPYKDPVESTAAPIMKRKVNNDNSTESNDDDEDDVINLKGNSIRCLKNLNHPSKQSNGFKQSDDDAEGHTDKKFTL